MMYRKGLHRGKRIFSYLLCMMLLFTAIEFPAMTVSGAEMSEEEVLEAVGLEEDDTEAINEEETETAEEEAAVDPNYIQNGNFENGFTEWKMYFNERYSASGDITNDYWAAITISFFLNWYDADGKDNGPVEWSTQLQYKDRLLLYPTKTYRLSFEAYSTVERPIKATFGEVEEYFDIGTTPQNYTMTFSPVYYRHDVLGFMMGPMENPNTHSKITTTEGHTVYIRNVRLVDVEDEDVVEKPSIIGVEDGAAYGFPTSARVSYRKNYQLTLKKDGAEIPYTEGDKISEDGTYEMTVVDSEDSSISVTKTFIVQNREVDYSKKYFVISNKSSEKVLTVTGVQDGAAVIQSAYCGDPKQFFTLEEAEDGYYVIRCLASDKVLEAPRFYKEVNIEQATYTGSDKQLWKLKEVPQGYVKLENKWSEMVMEVDSAYRVDKLQIQQYNDKGSEDEGQNGADGQRWDLISTIDVKEALEGKNIDVETEESWKQNAIITPTAEGLSAAGPVAVEWYQAPGEVASYDIYFDGEKVTKASIKATEDETMHLEDQDILYSTEVKEHTIKVVANYLDGRIVETNEVHFYISKKGIGWGTLHRVEDMNLSWYYHWSTDEALGTDEKIDFVPMMWGNYGTEWLENSENQKYGTILGFNEPDWSDQSNVPVSIESAKAWTERYNQANNADRKAPTSVEEVWQAFMDSGLRIGSPAPALAPPYCNGTITMNEVDGPDNWWYEFMDLMEEYKDQGWDYDFVAVHSYNADCDADAFLQMIDDTYEITKKPIWVTEFGVAKWSGEDADKWYGNNPETQRQVIRFMTKVLKGLEERDYVERYAWFPFNPATDNGASGIFDYSTGEVNDLGKVYAMLGLPEGYEGAQYDVEIPRIAEVKADKTTLEIGEEVQITVDAKVLEWKSTDNSIAYVDENGYVLAIGGDNAEGGDVTIEAVTEDDSIASIRIHVLGKETEENAKDNSSTNKGNSDTESKDTESKDTETKTTKPTVKWNVNYKTVPLQVKKSTTALKAIGLQEGDSIKSYSSSNKKVATVSKKGKITAKKVGTTTITVKTKNGASAKIKIKVQKSPVKVKKLTVNKTKVTLKKGKTFQLKVTKKYITALGKITYKSSNKKVATVSKNGKITAKKKGTATITIQCQKKRKTVKVTVK